MTEVEAKRKITSYLGFARRAGRVEIGVEQSTSASRRHGERCTVILASDASERTKKQVRDKCAATGAPLIDGVLSSDEIALTVGKRMNVSAAAITDKELASAAIEAYAAAGDTQLNERILPQKKEMR